MVAVDAATIWPEDAADVEEGIVATWFVRDGATVEEGDTLCEVQIEKVSVDVVAPVGGVVEREVEENEPFDQVQTLVRIEPG